MAGVSDGLIWKEATLTYKHLRLFLLVSDLTYRLFAVTATCMSTIIN